MPAKRLVAFAALLLTTTVTGCCDWCKNHCASCQQPAAAPAAYAPSGCCAPCYTPPAGACCTPGYQPAAAAVPAAGWQRPNPCCP